MAIVTIQHRRGEYADYDPSKVLPGELVVTQTGDPNTTDGEAAYIATKAGSVKRIPFASEVEDLKTEMEEVVEDAREAIASAIDPTLMQSGKAADAKKTGDEIADLKSDLSEIVPGLTDEAKEALLACFEHVEWGGNDGQAYYDALKSALNGETLPSEYSRVAYLESTGSQYIQTNILSQIPLEMHAKVMPRNGGEAPVIGAIDQTDKQNSRFFLLGFTSAVNTISTPYVANRFSASVIYDDVYEADATWLVTHNAISYDSPTEVISGIEYSGTSGKAHVYLNDGTSLVSTDDFDIPTPLSTPILLFIKPTSMSGVSMRLYYIKLYVHNELIFNGIPCIRNSDNKPGLYDFVSERFFINSGSGEFITG